MAAGQVALQQTVEQTVTGLGYELVEIERSAGGLLRITIDLPWVPGAVIDPFVTVEDCEKVTRQLQFALEVDGVEYRRLEVSSPGIDRPLRSEQDFERFAGSLVDITLKAPIGKELGAIAGGLISANRKKFRGTLERVGRGRRPGALADRLAGRTCGQTGPAGQRQACAGAVAGTGIYAGRVARGAPGARSGFQRSQAGWPRQAD
jgi:ribosome maturation factor RimP